MPDSRPPVPSLEPCPRCRSIAMEFFSSSDPLSWQCSKCELTWKPGEGSWFSPGRIVDLGLGDDSPLLGGDQPWIGPSLDPCPSCGTNLYVVDVTEDGLDRRCDKCLKARDAQSGRWWWPTKTF